MKESLVKPNVEKQRLFRVLFQCRRDKEMNQEEWKEARRQYYAASPPEELDFVVQAAIRQGRKKKTHRWIRPVLGAAAALFFVFITGLNSSSAFAQAAASLPLVGNVAKVLTFRAFHEEDASKQIDVRIPYIQDTGNTELEQRINKELRTKIDATVEAARKRAEEQQTAFLETGGTKEELIPVMITVDYQMKCSTPEVLSFAVLCTEVRANAYTEQTFYNIDLKTGAAITLRDLLGEDYVTIVNASIRQQMEERQQASPDARLWFEPDKGGFQGISENQRFYINQNGNPVISFEKYEIAPGYMGIQEFEIPKGALLEE